jgi:predicted DCC family thiol-disulfide oxidoreductase YuxK
MVRVFYNTNCGFCSHRINRLRRLNINHEIDFNDSSELNDFIKNKTDQEFFKEIDSIILIDNTGIKYYSDAVIRLFILTGGIYRILAIILGVIPLSVRDRVYKIIARYRYWFSCKVTI